jgi:uncharacterized membrane protein
MVDLVKSLAHAVAAGCDIAAIVTLALGAGAAVVRSLLSWRRLADLEFKKEVWLKFAATIVLALEFALAADIADTAVAPTWRDIGQLAAIAGIRTFLNYFLERDIGGMGRPAPGAGQAAE